MFKNIHLWVATRLFFLNKFRDCKIDNDQWDELIQCSVHEQLGITIDAINNLFPDNETDINRLRFIKKYFTERVKQEKKLIEIQVKE